MSTIISPNMNLPVPSVGNEQGPDYAFDINSCLTLLDQHDHSPGKGTQVTPAGLNINTDLSFQSHFGTNVAGITFQAQGVTPVPGTVYESGDDLYYVDGLGNNVRITQSGAVAGTPGSISNLVAPASVTYVAVNSTYVFQSDTNIAGNLDAGSVILRNITPNSTFGLTLQPPAALSSNYSITLPAAPVSTSFMQITSAGVISASVAVSQGIQDANIATATLTNRVFAAGTQTPINVIAVSSSTYTANTTDGQLNCNTTSNSITVTLYSAVNTGLTLRIRKTDSSVNQVIINPAGGSGQLIDGIAGVTLSKQFQSVTIMADGANWNVVDFEAAYEYQANTIPATTPSLTGSGSGVWRQLTNNSVGLTPGVWEVSGHITLSSDPDNTWANCAVQWGSDNGNNTTTLPGVYTNGSGITILDGQAGVPSAGFFTDSNYLSTSTYGSTMVVPTITVRIDQGSSSLIYINARANSNSTSNPKLNGYISAKRIGV